MLGNSFPLNFRQVKHAALLSKHGDSIIWHKKLGHFNVNALVYVQKHNMNQASTYCSLYSTAQWSLEEEEKNSNGDG
ncbi:hypothetical protein ACOSQ3_021537 [Xanthoceras sorbifolium]